MLYEVSYRKRWLCLMVCAAVVLVGCRSDPQIALIEREMRKLEDKNYELQFALEDSQRALEQCQGRRSPPASKPANFPAMGEPSFPPSDTEPSGAPRSVAPPTIELPNTPGQETLPETLRSPAGVPKPQPPNAPPAPGPAPKFKPGSQTRLPTSAPLADSSQVQKIVLNRELTGGYRPVGRTVDEGVSAFIELLDGRGQPIRAAGPIAVVVLDPQKKGEAARVGRWDFSTQEAASQFTQAIDASGIHLEMPWLDEHPTHRQLELFVRFTTSDGRRLEARRPIEVLLPGHDSTAQDSETQAVQQTSNVPELSAPELIAPANLLVPDAEDPNTAVPTSATQDDPLPPARPVVDAEPTKPVETVTRPTWSPYR